MNVDYLKNLLIPVKFKPESSLVPCSSNNSSWNIVNTYGETYHLYISDEKKHNQVFAQLCIKSITKQVAVDHKDLPVIMESDNCRPQYKSTLHFWGMEKIADEN